MGGILVRLDPIRTLQDLVALPSVNPMGQPASGPEYFELRVTGYLERLFREMDVPFERQFVDPMRENIMACLESDRPDAPVLMLEAHQDTVPVVGMTIDPFRPTIEGRRLYGRGSCDIKGGLAAMLAAFSRLAAERPVNRPTVVIAATVNEEHGFTGAAALARRLGDGSAVCRRKPVAAVIAEPTLLDVVVAHKGAVRWRCHARGRAAHSSQPSRGDNAIFRMARVLSALEEYQLQIAPRLGSHPLCGPTTLSVGTIGGGVSVNTVPDRCTIEIDRRLVPGESPAECREQVIAFLRERLGTDFPIDHDAPFLSGLGLPNQSNGNLAQSLAEIVRKFRGSAEVIGVPYGTNAATFANAGIPSVVFGPGSIEQAHTADEWLDLDQLEMATELYFQFASTWSA